MGGICCTPSPCPPPIRHHEAGGQDQEFINESVYVKEKFGFASPSEVLIITLLTEMWHQQHGGEHLSRLHTYTKFV